jgi:hypothetical protein
VGTSGSFEMAKVAVQTFLPADDLHAVTLTIRNGCRPTSAEGGGGVFLRNLQIHTASQSRTSPLTDMKLDLNGIGRENGDWI